MSSKPPTILMDDLFDFPPEHERWTASIPPYLPGKMIFQEELFDNFYPRGEGLPSLNLNMELFLGDNLRKLPKLREALYFARNAHSEQIKLFVESYGPIPIKLERYHSSKYQDVSFNWAMNPPPGIETDFLDQIEDYVWEYSPYYDPMQPNGIETTELRTVLGVEQLSDRETSEVNELLEEVHRFAIRRELLNASKPVEWLKENNHAFRYERSGSQCILVVDDPKIALYLKLTY